MKRILVGGCAALLVTAGCADDPSLYLGGPAGATERIQISSGDLTLTVGQSVTVGAAGLDAVGNVTGDTPSFSACAGSPVTVASGTAEHLYSGAATITAAANAVGAGCVNVTAGGVSDTIHVVVGPAGVRIAATDPIIGFDAQNPAANVFSFTAEPYDAGGNVITGSPPYTWSLSSTTPATVEPATGTVVTRGLGVTTLRLRAPNGPNDVLALTVAAPAFEGTLSAASGGQGDIITATRTAGPEFDANTTAFVNFGGVRAFLDAPVTASSARLAVPATGLAAAARGDIVFRNVGPSNVDRRAPFNLTSTGTGHRHAPNSNACATGPSYAANVSAGNWVYFSFTAGTAGYGGALPDIWFTYTNSTAAAQNVTVTLEWMSNTGGTPYADADLFAYLNCTGGAIAASQDYNPPEPPIEVLSGAAMTVPAGANLNIRTVVFSAQGAAFSNARVRVVVN